MNGEQPHGERQLAGLGSPSETLLPRRAQVRTSAACSLACLAGRPCDATPSSGGADGM